MVADVVAEKLKKEISANHTEDHRQLAEIMPDLKRLADAFRETEKMAWRGFWKVLKIAFAGSIIYLFGGSFKDRVIELLKYL